MEKQVIEKGPGLSENFLALIILIGCAAVLALVAPQGILGEAFGQPLPRLMIFTGYWLGLLFFIGGWRWKVIPWLKDRPVSFALIFSSIVLGAAMVLTK